MLYSILIAIALVQPSQAKVKIAQNEHKLEVLIEKTISDFTGLEKYLKTEVTDEEEKPIPLAKSTPVFLLDKKYTQNKKILVFFYENVDSPDIGSYCGSGGCRLLVLTESSLGKFKILLADNFINLIGIIPKGNNLPDFIFGCHGSAFNRTGNDFDYCQFIFNSNKKKYERAPKEIKDINKVEGIKK